MIAGLSVLALVPARGGSKGLPHKNIADLAGKPLIGWTLNAARTSRYIDRCVVSTDSEEIAAVARRYGGDAPFLRPPELAGDASSPQDAIKHALAQLPAFDIVVLLQPTSPLRSSNDIDGALDTLLTTGAPSCVSVVEPGKSPYWSYRVDEQQRLQPLLDPVLSRMRRQDLPAAYVLNGAVYAARTAWLLDNQGYLGNGTVAYVMPGDRSVDIDNAFDLELAALYLRHRQKASAA
ncbi:MAG: acylneuraminate cytidylyltransferase family protein [Gammaproteobacteria bacterium]|nr:acylneuraminate cytidylyltransferase family protein [Gammaproteobacteria bacterium]